MDRTADEPAGPEVGTDDLMPAIVGETSDEEMWHHVEDAATFNADHHFDTDDELGYDDWYGAPRGTCRGEAENVLGRERPFNPVDWAINTSSSPMDIDLSVGSW